MELLIALVLVGILVWAWRRNATSKKENDARNRPLNEYGSAGASHGSVVDDGSQMRVEIDRAVQRDLGRSAVSPDLRRIRPETAEDHFPRPPAGGGAEPWSPRTQQLEVAGEWYRADNLRTLFSRHSKVSESGAEIRLPAVLVPDPVNPHDSNAVAVFVDGLHVGYMERPDAKKYHRHIAALAGGELVVSSRQWLRASGQDTWARVTLSLPLPQHLRCPNPWESDSVSLPPGSTVQVTKEEDFMPHLASLLDRYGSETVVAASLRSVTEERPRSSVELVAVDIDAEQVGVLTPTQTANFLPLVRRAEAEGRNVVCRASLRGNTLNADVALHARKAHELDESELQRLFAGRPE